MTNKKTTVKVRVKSTFPHGGKMVAARSEIEVDAGQVSELVQLGRIYPPEAKAAKSGTSDGASNGGG